MPRWLIKSDPGEYSAADLERDGRTAWTGVKNAAALLHLRRMAAGDDVLVYHTGGEKAVVAVARVHGPPRPDPADRGGRLVMVDVAFVRWLKNPVPLARIRPDPAFRDFDLVRISRLSVMPVSEAHCTRLLQLSDSPWPSTPRAG